MNDEYKIEVEVQIEFKSGSSWIFNAYFTAIKDFKNIKIGIEKSMSMDKKFGVISFYDTSLGVVFIDLADISMICLKEV